MLCYHLARNPSWKPVAQFALWLSVTRYADKWANYAIHNFPNWSPAVDHDGRTVLKFTNKVWCNMVPGQNDDNFHHYPTFSVNTTANCGRENRIKSCYKI